MTPTPGPYCFQLARELTLPFANSNAPESGSFSCLSSTAELTLLMEGQVNQSQNMSIISFPHPHYHHHLADGEGVASYSDLIP